MTALSQDVLGQHFINQQWIGSGPSFPSYDPIANKESPWTFFEATETQVEQAVQAAHNAFIKYRQTTPEQRATFLEAIAQEIETLKADIIQAAMLETGLPEARLQGEAGRTCNQLLMFANFLRQPNTDVQIDTADPNRSPLPKPDTRLSYLPLGPVVVFGASNFPLAFSTAGGDTASALAAGCPVIVKGHPLHAATSELVTKAIEKAVIKSQVPSGVFNLLQSSKPDTAAAIVKHPLIKAVGFTGSLKVGRILADLCAQRNEPIPFYGELGSTNPQVLLPNQLETNAESLATTQVQSMMMGHGQFCTSPGLLIALKGNSLERYKNKLALVMKEQESAPMLSSSIASQYQEKTSSLASHLATLTIAEGNAPSKEHHTQPKCFCVSANAFLQESMLQQEVFGPCSIIVECNDTDELLRVISKLEGQLTASIHGDQVDIEQHKNIIHELSYKVGRLIFNQMPTGVEVCHSMNHGGPYPASTDVKTTSVGIKAINRFLRPICFQNAPTSILPNELH
ncbi:aldehyde dehydrogenase (NADP(+)) [Parashewanella curva]|uniref:Aldehyde dehydrogenase (NADP(+)) n=1 Tax=Parashewanella curva TaxID=2338552 RepID=A0A3L8PVA2_9GAMM|nr:aldehyde dehydrogenase (NADP(+)) [Parashewanella curva]RLV58358.1 aldehyde dehydrogenase (NADP(+)) [Parashewanella curva]